MKKELNDSTIKEKKEYLHRLERRLDELAIVQEKAEKEAKKVQKELGLSDPDMMGWENAMGLFLLIAASGSFAYALIRDPIITGSAIGSSGVGSPSIIFALTALLLVIFLVLPRQK